ncbi:hypothetical protein HDU82_004090 [Entophlyctis luteolus]|nr:hypothetical protein HDU82_004090 [Entophlyctis luteolus]
MPPLKNAPHVPVTPVETALAAVAVVIMLAACIYICAHAATLAVASFKQALRGPVAVALDDHADDALCAAANVDGAGSGERLDYEAIEREVAAFAQMKRDGKSLPHPRHMPTAATAADLTASSLDAGVPHFQGIKRRKTTAGFPRADQKQAEKILKSLKEIEKIEDSDESDAPIAEHVEI